MFGAEMKRVRAEADMSVRELAKRLRVSAPYIVDIEYGARSPFPLARSAIYTRLVEALGGTVEKWMGLAVADRIGAETCYLSAHVFTLIRTLAAHGHELDEYDVRAATKAAFDK